MIHTANAVIDEMKGMADEKRRQTLMKFFKTGKGEYGEGDKFLGLRMQQVRGVAKKHHDMERGEIYSLLQSDLHDARLCALLILAAQFDSLCGRRMTDDAEAMEKRDDIGKRREGKQLGPRRPLRAENTRAVARAAVAPYVKGEDRGHRQARRQRQPVEGAHLDGLHMGAAAPWRP